MSHGSGGGGSGSPYLNRPQRVYVQEPKIKITLSLYKVQQSIYLLDFQRVEGDAFSFMKLCAFIITELKNLSAASRTATSQQQQSQQQSQGQQQQTPQQHHIQMNAAAAVRS